MTEPVVGDSSPTEEPVVVYVRENPLVKLFVGTLVAIAGTVVFLFGVGFAMSFVGFRPPHFDREILNDQWAKMVQHPARSYDDCVAKGGAVGESWPPTCSYKGDSFTQPLTDACALSPEVALCDTTPATRP